MDPDKTYRAGLRLIDLHLSKNESDGHWRIQIG